MPNPIGGDHPDPIIFSSIFIGVPAHEACTHVFFRPSRTVHCLSGEKSGQQPAQCLINDLAKDLAQNQAMPRGLKKGLNAHVGRV